MAKDVFDPAKHYMACLWGHNFDKSLIYYNLPGHFEPDTIDHFDPITKEKEWAIFTVDDPDKGEYPYHWAGPHRLPMSVLRTICRPVEIP